MNVKFYKITTGLPDFVAASHSGIFVWTTYTANDYKSGLYFGGASGWEYLTNDSTYLDVAEFALATDNNGVVTIKGIKEVDGKIAVGTDTTKDVTFAKVATTGTAADVSITDSGSIITATTVEGALQEIAAEIDAMDADLDASGTAQHSGTFVMSGITEVDGKITAIDSVEVEAAGAAATVKSEVIGTNSDTASDNTIYGAKAYADDAIATAVDGLDVTEFALAEKDSNTNVVTIHGISETDGEIAVGSADANDIELAPVAATGKAEDVSYDSTYSGLTATDVQAAIDEVAATSAGGVGSKTVYITSTAGGSGDAYSKRYGIYQGATGSSSFPVAGEKLADIDIPKDMVVESGTVGTVTTANTPYAGATVGDKYIDLVIANATSDHIYIPVNSLVDIYTAQQNATQVQLAIDSNNVISATVVAGSIGTTELANNAVTTAKIADDAVTADKVNIAAHTKSQTAGADGLAISVTTTDGQVSAVSASIAANTYESYGAVSTAISGLDSVADADGGSGNAAVTDLTTPSGDFKVLNSVRESDGKLTAADAYTLKKVAATGKAEDVSYAGNPDVAGSEPATVEAALDDLYEKVADAAAAGVLSVDSKTGTLTTSRTLTLADVAGDGSDYVEGVTITDTLTISNGDNSDVTKTSAYTIGSNNPSLTVAQDNNDKEVVFDLVWLESLS